MKTRIERYVVGISGLAMILIIIILALTGCCFAQIPTQYVYADDSCKAVIPDYREMVVVWDNCDVPSVEQEPEDGTEIDGTTMVRISAIDGVGNRRSMTFDVVLLDTIAPTMQLNPEWTGYSDKEVEDMYRTFYGWVQTHKDEFVESYAWDTIWHSGFNLNGEIQDETIVFNNTILFPDTLRMDWWVGSNYPEQ